MGLEDVEDVDAKDAAGRALSSPSCRQSPPHSAASPPPPPLPLPPFPTPTPYSPEKELTTLLPLLRLLLLLGLVGRLGLLGLSVSAVLSSLQNRVARTSFSAFLARPASFFEFPPLFGGILSVLCGEM